MALIKDRLALNRNILAIFLVFLTSSTLGAIRSYIDCLAHNRIDLSVKRSVFERIVSGMPRDNMRIGEMISIIEGDSSAVGQFYIGSLMNLIVNLMTCLISGYFAFSISPMLTLILFLTFMLSFASSTVFGGLMARSHRIMRELTDRYLSSLQESLSGLYEIYIFNAGRIFVNKIGGELSAVYRQKLKTTLIGIRSSISDGFIAMVSQIVSLLYACNLIMNGTITVGSYVAISIYLRYFGSSLQSIVSVNLKFKSVLVSFERLLSIYDSFLEKPVRYERLEYDLLSVLHELSATTSIVIVSHRLSTVIGLERIIVMDKGAILAQGRHEELLDTCEAYRDLFLPQWEEYLENMKKNGIPEEVLL